MTITNFDLLPALGTLQAHACKTNRHGNSLRFRFRRTAVDALPAVSELADRGATVRVYTGGLIYTCVNGRWSTRRSPKVRAWTTVEVAG